MKLVCTRLRTHLSFAFSNLQCQQCVSQFGPFVLKVVISFFRHRTAYILGSGYRAFTYAWGFWFTRRRTDIFLPALLRLASSFPVAWSRTDLLSHLSDVCAP